MENYLWKTSIFVSKILSTQLYKQQAVWYLKGWTIWWSNRIQSLKYLRSTLGCKEIETKNHRLWQGYNFFLCKWSIIKLLQIQRQENKFVIVLSWLGMKFSKYVEHTNLLFLSTAI